MLIGAHVGVAGGYPQALEYARDVGAECVQIFAKSPRQWQARAFDVAVAEMFRATRDVLGINPVFTHTAYLINLGTTDSSLRHKSITALGDELERATLLGVDAVITHIGTNGGTGIDETAERVATAIAHALSSAGPTAPRLLLENTAGAGTTFGNSPEEIGAVLHALPDHFRPRVGVCIDSCHAHAAGYNLSSAEGWASLVDAFDACCGADAICAVHANDCMFPSGSRRDRHAWIGDGTIGYDGFAGMLCEPRLRGIAAITEMPGDVPDKDRENISRLKRLRDGCAERA
ncbi:MAG: deoxyribonuclease IV [Coriobacteriia bacterium]|nr:deoxyribonuclease IV [Coriobacteriia bacterium]